MFTFACTVDMWRGNLLWGTASVLLTSEGQRMCHLCPSLVFLNDSADSISFLLDWRMFVPHRPPEEKQDSHAQSVHDLIDTQRIADHAGEEQHGD